MDPASRRVIEHAPLAIFDFDGTLVTLGTDWKRLKADLRQKAIQNDWPWSDQTGLDQNLRTVRSAAGEAAFAEMCGMVTEAEVAGFSPHRVSNKLVRIMHERDPDPVAIVTNNTRQAVEQIMKHPVFMGLRPHIVGKEDVYESKPAPQGLLQVCRLFVSSPKATVFIGDTDNDALAARAARVGIFLRVTPPGESTMGLRLAA